MTNEGKATLLTALWFAGFAAGLVIGAEKSAAVGLMIMAFVTVLFVTCLYASGRIETAEENTKNRLRPYKADCERRTREVLRK